MDNTSDEYNINTRKSKRKNNNINNELIDDSFNEMNDKYINNNNELNSIIATAIFEYGLKNSSPKILIGLMPSYPGLNTEHIKSHLQKYRIHSDRSKEEFSNYYRESIDQSFVSFISNKKGFDNITIDKTNKSNETFNNQSNEHMNKKIKSNPKTVACKQADQLLEEWKSLYIDVLNENEKFLGQLTNQITEDKSATLLSIEDYSPYEDVKSENEIYSNNYILHSSNIKQYEINHNHLAIKQETSQYQIENVIESKENYLSSSIDNQ